MNYSREMLDICARHTRGPNDDVVIREAYLPYIPENWNGILVLAEAQNLSNENEGYVQTLQDKTPDERMTRLRDPEDVGVAPWDDGSLKLAVEAALGVSADETAVSNAVPWSRRDGRKNVSPSNEMEKWAVEFWKDLLPLFEPTLTRIVAAGNVAERVIMRAIKRANRPKQYEVVPLRLPSPHMSRVSGMFWEEDLLLRYPEVRKVVERHPEWCKENRRNKVFFACHAVSTVRKLGVA